MDQRAAAGAGFEPPDGDLGDELFPGEVLPVVPSFEELLPPEPDSLEGEPESPEEPLDDDPGSLVLPPDFSAVVVVVPDSPDGAAARLSLR